jgi:hypothetical protein
MSLGSVVDGWRQALAIRGWSPTGTTEAEKRRQGKVLGEKGTLRGERRREE